MANNMYIIDKNMLKYDTHQRSPFYSVVAAGFEVCGPRWSWEYRNQEKEDGFMIWLVHGGRAWLKWDQDQMEVSRGDCILMPVCRDCIYIGRHDQEHPLNVFWAILDPSEEGIRRAHFEMIPFHSSVEITGMLQSLCVRLARSQGKSRDEYGSVLLLEISTHTAGRKRDLRELVLKMIQEHGYGLRVETIARELGYSYDHLIRSFSAEVGCTPKQFITSERMNRAVELVEHSPLQMKQIAYELGYPDQFSFSKQFSKSIGVSPRGYREKGEERTVQ